MPKQLKEMNRAIPEANSLACFEFQVHCFITVTHETTSTQKMIWSSFASLDCLYFWRHGARLAAFSLRKCKMFYCLYLFCSWGGKLQTQALLPANYSNVALKVFILLPKLQVLSIPIPERDSCRQPVRKREKRKDICFFFRLVTDWALRLPDSWLKSQ